MGDVLVTREPAYPFVNDREAALPKWAQRTISDLRAEAINYDMGLCVTDVVRTKATEIAGGNCAFADDDVSLLAFLARRAADAGLIDGLPEPLQRSIASATEARRAATTGAVHDGAVAQPDAPNLSSEDNN